MIKLTLEETKSCVRIGNEVTENFEVGEGVKQGDPLSSTLFNLVLEYIMREANINRTGLIYHKRHQCLAFADDIAIVSRSKKELREVLIRLEQSAEKMGLEISEKKTKYMEWNRNEVRRDGKLEIRTAKGKLYSFQEVESFTYLGAEFTKKPNIKKEIQNRLQKGNKCMYKLRNVMNSKLLSRNAKIRIYKSVLRPVVLFGSETWTMGKSEQKMLAIWERKCLRRIYKGKKVGETWQRRSNKELKELFDQPDIIGTVKGSRLRWIGHLERMKNERVPKKIIESGIGGKRIRGRPKVRWMDEVMEDIKEIKIMDWRSKAKNRKEWRKKINQAMGLLGLQC